MDDAGIDGGGFIGDGDGKRLAEFVNFDHIGDKLGLFGDVDDPGDTCQNDETGDDPHDLPHQP